MGVAVSTGPACATTVTSAVASTAARRKLMRGSYPSSDARSKPACRASARRRAHPVQLREERLQLVERAVRATPALRAAGEDGLEAAIEADELLLDPGGGRGRRVAELIRRALRAGEVGDDPVRHPRRAADPLAHALDAPELALHALRRRIVV